VTTATEHSFIEAFIKDITVAAATVTTKGAIAARVVIREVEADSSVLGYS
jgi:phenylpyruvate tautomerase PptA (4-oxalocrotonate tautomerase family)